MKLVREIVSVLSLVLVAWLSETASAQTNVTFPDPNLEAAVRSALGKPTGALTNEDLQGLTSLSASYQNITNLSGLEWATNLASLYLAGNSISDLTPLQGLNRLVHSILDRNRISDLSPLAALSSLTELNLGNNLITTGDGLSGLTNLTSLWLSGNSISNLTFLHDLRWLTSLGLENNPINELSPLATLTNLSSLVLGGSPISDYSTLSGLTLLTNLSVRDGSITNLATLQHLWRLTSLILYKNFVTDLSPLAGLTNLSYLDLRWNAITNYDVVLAGATNLTTLYLGGNSISNVAFLDHLVRLTFLNLGDNQISDLSPLAMLTNLSYAVLSGNPITNYSVLSGLTELVNLELRGNSISNLTFISGLSRLSYVDLAYNSISDPWPLATLTNLNALVLAGNPITNFTGLSGLTNLVGLWLYKNSVSNLTFLDGLKRLTHLILDDNRIADLSPLAGLTNLTNLGLGSNPVTNYLVLAELTNLTHLSVAGNSISNLSFAEGLIRLESLNFRNNRFRDTTALSGLTNLVSVEADYNHLTNIVTLPNLPHLSRAGLVGNLLDLSTNSPASTVIQSLQSRQVSVSYQPQNQPPNLSLPTRWFIATNVTSSLSFYVYDDITPGDKLVVEAHSSNTGLISNENILLEGTNNSRSLAVTPTADQISSTAITLTVTDDAGLSTSFAVLVTVMIPEVVVFSDPNLEATIHQTLGKSTGDFTSVDLQGLTYLYTFDTNITDLSGLEWATNLSSLFLNGNSISNLSVLPTLPGLTFLGLNNNSVADLSSLTGLTNVTGLSLHGDAISNVTFLQNMPQLTSLSLAINRITDLSPLAGLTNLGFLSLQQNLLTNIGPIQDLPQLSYVNLSLNLLDVNSNSPARTVIDSLRGRGVTADYLPQRGPPTFVVLTNWLVAADTASWLGFGVLDDGPSADQIIVTASSSDANLMPDANLAVYHIKRTYWALTGTPTSNQTGAATITLTAKDDAGLTNSVTLLVTVANPLPLNDQVLNATTSTWVTGGNAAWFGQTNSAYDGVSAARSGSIGDNQESWLETTLNGPGVLTFWWKVSSESEFDFLNFYIDGVLRSNRISGEVNWQQQTVILPLGIHTVRWQYSKDDAVSSGLDSAWLDQVTFVPLSWLELRGPPTNGQSQLILHGVPGKLYEVLASTNIADWFSLDFVSPTNNAMPFVATAPASRAGFYRLRDWPASSIWLEKPTWLTNGSVQLVVHSPPGTRLELQASTNLLNWSVLATVTNALGTVAYTDPLAANSSRRFYRAAIVP